MGIWMNVETFINKVGEIASDSEFREELERGLKIQFTIDKEHTDIVVLKPTSTAPERSEQ
ncbi:MAG: hypothetical protein ACYSTF_04680 [Planctomycetota bacterium]